jgi:hypothetical protein
MQCFKDFDAIGFVPGEALRLHDLRARGPRDEGSRAITAGIGNALVDLYTALAHVGPCSVKCPVEIDTIGRLAAARTLMSAN